MIVAEKNSYSIWIGNLSTLQLVVPCIIELALLNSHQMLESFFRWALVAAAAALIGASIKNLLD